MYENSSAELASSQGRKISEREMEKADSHFKEFYQDVFVECQKFGEIVDLIVADNVGDHMVGNVYVRYAKESEAIYCLEKMKDSCYDNRQLKCEFSPV